MLVNRLSSLVIAALLLAAFAAHADRWDRSQQQRAKWDVVDHINQAFGRGQSSRRLVDERSVTLRVRAVRPGNWQSHRFTFTAKIDHHRVAGAGSISAVTRQAIVERMKIAQ